MSTTVPDSSTQRWPWMWKVWKSLSIAKTWKATRLADLRLRSVGVLPAYAWPLMHEKLRSSPVASG